MKKPLLLAIAIGLVSFYSCSKDEEKAAVTAPVNATPTVSTNLRTYDNPSLKFRLTVPANWAVQITDTMISGQKAVLEGARLDTSVLVPPSIMVLTREHTGPNDPMLFLGTSLGFMKMDTVNFKDLTVDSTTLKTTTVNGTSVAECEFTFSITGLPFPFKNRMMYLIHAGAATTNDIVLTYNAMPTIFLSAECDSIRSGISCY